MSRIERHPIVKKGARPSFTFTFAGQPVEAWDGEMIASALFAAGIRTFGHHPKDGSPQGLYCANGQCAQCLVLADGLPVKACMTPAQPGLRVEPVDGLPVLPPAAGTLALREVETVSTPVLILGAGPAGLSAAIELGTRGVQVLVVDDKDHVGGKLVLQTHRFFGSTQAVHAGTRGIDIADRLADSLSKLPTADIWLKSTALAVFSDRAVGILRDGTYVLVRPEILLVATGAREKSLLFRGNTLPGVYGAGAFQTLVNRDLVRAADRLFIVGGGNVGLIAGYHALQAGIDVVGLVEALPECGGYHVHRDKLARLGVPIHTSHTVLSANGREQVDSVTIARIDPSFRPIPGTEKTFACDTVLVAVGLDPVDEFYHAAKEADMPVYAAGDAEEIAEASAAIFSGRIKGMEIARALGSTQEAVPADWETFAAVLKSKPGRVIDRPSPLEDEHGRVYPVFHCSQEIPCNPCTSVCPQGLIRIEGADIRGLPHFTSTESGKACIGCERCVAICPGLAITLVDGRGDPERPVVTVPFELGAHRLAAEEEVDVVDVTGASLGSMRILEIRALPHNDRTVLLKVQAEKAIAPRIAGVRVQPPWVSQPLPEAVEPLSDDMIVCRCERVTAGEIRAWIDAGVRDMNEIKAVTRAGMGACGGKTCQSLIERLFREAGIPRDDLTPNVPRPLFVEVPLGTFAGVGGTGPRAARDVAATAKGPDSLQEGEV